MNNKQEIEKLCEEHIKLVGFVIAKEFKCFTEKYPYLREDLYQEGCIGLLEAAKKYDKSKGEFSTIACICIRNEMKKFVKRYVYKHYNEKFTSLNDEKYGKDESMTLESMIKNTDIDTVELLLERENLEKIKKCINRSEIESIQEIIRFRLESKSQTEISKKVGCSQVHVSRRLQKLRKELAEVC